LIIDSLMPSWQGIKFYTADRYIDSSKAIRISKSYKKK